VAGARPRPRPRGLPPATVVVTNTAVLKSVTPASGDAIIVKWQNFKQIDP